MVTGFLPVFSPYAHKAAVMDSDVLPNALLVEDDAQDRLEVRLHLELMGFVVYDTPSRSHAQELFDLRDYSIVLIHLGHAPMESMQLCRAIRAASTVPIIMLTKRDETIDEEMVLMAGADDYVTKPVTARILTARVTQQMKRGESQRHPRANILTWGPLEMDLSQHRFTVSGVEVSLTNAEYQFLHLLMASPDRVFSREQIIDAIGSFRGVGSDHLVDNHASRLRKKIRTNGGPEVIKVIRSVGFRLAPLATLTPPPTT
jgi:DNA-binding response OmpR family regulator